MGLRPSEQPIRMSYEREDPNIGVGQARKYKMTGGEGFAGQLEMSV